MEKGEQIVRDSGLFILMSLFWALNYSFLKIALIYEPPLVVLLFRIIFAAIFSVIFSYSSLKALKGIGFIKLLIMSLLNISLFMTLWFLGEETEPASISSILIYTYPIISVLFSSLFLNEKLTILKIIGTFIGFIGLVVIFIYQIRVEFSIGLFLLLSGAFMWAFGTVYYKKYLGTINQGAINSIQFIYAIPVILIFAAFEGGFKTLNLNFILITLYMGSLGTAVAYFIYLSLLKRYNVSHISPYLFSVPAFSIFLSIIINKEIITFNTLAGFLLISIGIFLSSR
ncbi:MAG: DMT family transporter [Thermoplasmata archaeon]